MRNTALLILFVVALISCSDNNSTVQLVTSSQTKEVTYNPEFYLMKHFSRFIESGAQKLESSDPNCLAFKDSEKIVVAYYNHGNNAEKEFVIGDKKFAAALNAKSINTFIIPI